MKTNIFIVLISLIIGISCGVFTFTLPYKDTERLSIYLLAELGYLSAQEQIASAFYEKANFYDENYRRRENTEIEDDAEYWIKRAAQNDSRWAQEKFKLLHFTEYFDLGKVPDDAVMKGPEVYRKSKTPTHLLLEKIKAKEEAAEKIKDVMGGPAVKTE